MAEKRHIRIVAGQGGRMLAQVTDAETGREIHGVVSFRIDADANRDGDEFLLAELDVLAEIDVTTEATVRRMRLNEETGVLEEIEA